MNLLERPFLYLIDEPFLYLITTPYDSSNFKANRRNQQIKLGRPKTAKIRFASPIFSNEKKVVKTVYKKLLQSAQVQG